MCIFQGNPISSMKLATGAEKGPASRRGTVVGAALLLCMAMAATGAQAADTERSETGRDANSMQVQPNTLPATLQRTEKLARADAAFLKEAAENNHAEIEGSNLALQKATNPQTKAFAQRMLDDHGKTGQELASLAAAKGVDLPKEASMLQKAKLKLLNMANAADFDRMYGESIGVNAHADTIDLFRKAAAEAKDPDVKAFATRTLPALQRHLDMARQLPGVQSGKGATTH